MLLFVCRLNRLQVPYMVTGSTACIAYGVPRLTYDIDVVIELERKQIRDIRGILDVSGEALDWPELRRHIDEGELQRSWSRVEELPL